MLSRLIDSLSETTRGDVALYITPTAIQRLCSAGMTFYNTVNLLRTRSILLGSKPLQVKTVWYTLLAWHPSSSVL
jgi:hypothetical protein